jgi:biotin carboxyl carrier protein
MRRFNIAVNGTRYEVEVEEIDGGYIPVPTRPAAAPSVLRSVPAPESQSAPASAQAGKKTVAAPMPGTILSILVKQGEAVTKGQTLLILEAMKMENKIKSGADGVVALIAVKEGETVNTGQVLIQLA